MFILSLIQIYYGNASDNGTSEEDKNGGIVSHLGTLVSLGMEHIHFFKMHLAISDVPEPVLFKQLKQDIPLKNLIVTHILYSDMT